MAETSAKNTSPHCLTAGEVDGEVDGELGGVMEWGR